MYRVIKNGNDEYVLQEKVHHFYSDTHKFVDKEYFSKEKAALKRFHKLISDVKELRNRDVVKDVIIEDDL